MLVQADVHVDPVGPQVDEVHLAEVPLAERAMLGLPQLGQLVITAGDRPLVEPRN